MLSLGVIGFAAPAALLALIVLPVLWWLLRATPPPPRRIAFPPIRFLLGLGASEESAARTPPWLLVVRLALAIALIAGAAAPVIDAERGSAAAGPTVLVIDNGWAAARNWSSITATLARLIDDADRGRRAVVVLPTAPAAAADDDAELRALSARAARTRAHAIAPQPWPTERMAAARSLDRLAAGGMLAGAQVFWLSDGLAEPGATTSEFAAALARHGTVTVFEPSPAALPRLLAAAGGDGGGGDGGGGDGGGADVIVQRMAPAAAAAALLLTGDDGQPLARQDVAFAADAPRAAAGLDLPPAWRARLARIEIAGENHAGAVLLVDARWRRIDVGIVNAATSARAQPLLAGAHYVARALEPFAEVRTGGSEQVLAAGAAMIVLIDEPPLSGEPARRLRAFVTAGGVLVRFAGPALAAAPPHDDALLPVRLLGRDRATGGALSWTKAATLAPFAPDGPFAGLDPRTDVAVHRQVLAEPGADSQGTVWARLDDGTPLVTGRRDGAGWLVLFHTAADPSWSSLPLSGLFVEMLQRIAELANRGAGSDRGRALVAQATLDGFGRLGAPPSSAGPIMAEALASLVPGPRHPPGYYGDGGERRAFNLAGALPPVAPLADDLSGVNRKTYDGTVAVDLRPWLLGAALALAVFDLAASMVLRGLIPRTVARRAAAAGAAIIAAGTAVPALAASPAAPPATAPAAALELRLAFIVTGDAGTDALSRSGLAGLSAVLNQRTAVELGPPVGVDPATDELLFYPMVYWPLAGGDPALSPAAIVRLKDYRLRGGTIVFDGRTRGAGAPAAALRALAGGLDLPPLQPAPDDHLLRRAYYLLGELPGRWVGDPVWVDAPDADVNDGVATVVAGSNDWAGAWATDAAARPLLPVLPGGERQRELAYRFGVNLVMYALTGSYKADQVHLPAILERLQR